METFKKPIINPMEKNISKVEESSPLPQTVVEFAVEMAMEKLKDFDAETQKKAIAEIRTNQNINMMFASQYNSLKNAGRDIDFIKSKVWEGDKEGKRSGIINQLSSFRALINAPEAKDYVSKDAFKVHVQKINDLNTQHRLRLENNPSDANSLVKQYAYVVSGILNAGYSKEIKEEYTKALEKFTADAHKASSATTH